MASKVIEEFLVGLGFKVDSVSLAAAAKGLELVRVGVKSVIAAATAMAVAVEEAVRRTANNYEKLFYLSQQTGVMVTDLRNLQFAFEQVGLSADQATGLISRLASAMRDNPSWANYISSITGVPNINNAKDALAALTKEYNRVIRAGEQEYIIRAEIRNIGLDPDVIRQSADNMEEQAKWTQQRAAWLAKLGLDEEKLAANSKRFNQERGYAWMLFEVAIARMVDILLPSLTRIFQWIADWFEREGAKKVQEWGEAIEKWLADPKTWDKIWAGFKLVTDVASGFLVVLEGIVTAARWMAENPVLAGTVMGAAAGAMVGGPWGMAAGAVAGAGLGKYFEYQLYQQEKERKKREFIEAKKGSAEDFETEWLKEHPWSPESVDPRDDAGGVHPHLDPGRPHTYAGAPFGGPQGSQPLGGIGYGSDLLEFLLQGFQHWWAGSNAFRPFVQLAEETYEKLADALRLGLGMGEGIGGAAAGARAGAEGVQRGAGVGGGEGGGAGGAAPGGGAQVPTSEHAKSLIGMLTSLGVKKEVAEGAVAYADWNESHLDPNVVNSIGAHGIFQWLGARKAAMIAKYGARPTFEQQQEFAKSELTTGDQQGTLAALKRAQTQHEGYRIWGAQYEIPGAAALAKAEAEYQRRGGRIDYSAAAGGGGGAGGGDLVRGLKGVNLEFAQNLSRAIKAAYAATGEMLHVTSGDRTQEHQAELLRASGGSGMVGSATGSKHVHHTAVDLGMDAQRALGWLHQHGREFGVHFPLMHGLTPRPEPWHVEPEWSRDPGASERERGARVSANTTNNVTINNPTDPHRTAQEVREAMDRNSKLHQRHLAKHLRTAVV